MKSLNLSSGNINNVLKMNGSKSYANRALIKAALIKTKPIYLHHLPQAQDTDDLIEVLKKLGMNIEIKDDTAKINSTFPECLTQNEYELFLGEGGTTVRFLLPFMAISKAKFKLSIHEHLQKRPLTPLIFHLKNLGVNVSQDHFPLEMQGPISKNSDLLVDTEQTSQFLSAFLLVQKELHLNLRFSSLTTSENYYLMTKKVLSVLEHQTEFTIPNDFSAMANFIFYGLLNHKIEITNCFEWDDLQGECEIFKTFNLKFSPHLIIEPLKNKKINLLFDVKNCLDIVPPLAFFCSYLEGEHIITNTKNLIFKETNRISEIQKILELFGKKMEILDKGNILKIYGASKKTFDPVEVHCPDDHRIVMMAYLFLKHNAGGKLINIEPVKKSFRNFFELCENQ